MLCHLSRCLYVFCALNCITEMSAYRISEGKNLCFSLDYLGLSIVKSQTETATGRDICGLLFHKGLCKCSRGMGGTIIIAGYGRVNGSGSSLLILEYPQLNDYFEHIDYLEHLEVRMVPTYAFGFFEISVSLPSQIYKTQLQCFLRN